MDLRKEIKFSDLIPKRGKKKDAPAAADAETVAEKPAKEKRSFSFARKAKESKPRERKQKERKPKERKPKAAAKSAGRPSRHKKLVGLKIGASQLAAARVVNNCSPDVVQLAREGLEPGVEARRQGRGGAELGAGHAGMVTTPSDISGQRGGT